VVFQEEEKRCGAVKGGGETRLMFQKVDKGQVWCFRRRRIGQFGGSGGGGSASVVVQEEEDGKCGGSGGGGSASVVVQEEEERQVWRFMSRRIGKCGCSGGG